MELRAFGELYRNNEPLYYSNQKESSKNVLSEHIQHSPIEVRKQVIKVFEKQLFWKEYEYWAYHLLLRRHTDCADINVVSLQLLNALVGNVKEIVIIAMDIFKQLGTRIHLESLVKHYFHLHGHNPPDMSYYAYFIPTIKSIHGDNGLDIVQQNCTKSYALSYKLHSLKFSQRVTYTKFIKLLRAENVSTYEDSDLIELLFEVICKRREKALAYEPDEIAFIVDNLPGINAPAINNFKYFLSHVCVTYNRRNCANTAPDCSKYIELLKLVQHKCLLMLSEEDTTKVRRGVRIYTDFHDCVVKSTYKTMYTLMEQDIQSEKASPLYLALLDAQDALILNGSAEHLRFIAALMNDSNFHLFEAIFTRFNFTSIFNLHEVLRFYNNLEDVYLEDKIDGLICLMLPYWFGSSEKRQLLIEDMLQEVFSHCLSYDLYRAMKIVAFVLGDLSQTEIFKLEQRLMLIVDEIMDKQLLKEPMSKLYERILVCSLDLLVKSSHQVQSQPISAEQLQLILAYLEKGIFCNKRYAASASGSIYRKFVATHFCAHQECLIAYLRQVLQRVGCFDPNASNMRRCLEKRILVHEFCLAMGREHQADVARMICNICAEKLAASLRPQPEIAVDDGDVKMCIFSVNALMGDASLKQLTQEFVLPLLEFTLNGVDKYSKHFGVCNAVYTLYATLVQRLLPHHDNTKNMTLHSLLVLCPSVLKHFTGTESAISGSTKSSVLVMQLLQRTNNESPFTNFDNCAAQQVINQLWAMIASPKPSSCKTIQFCGLVIDSTVKLWLNLSRLGDAPNEVQRVQKLHLTGDKQSLNFLHVKYKLLQGLARKCNALHRNQSLLHSLAQHSVEDVSFCKNKMRIQPPKSLECFRLKELAIGASLGRILSEDADIYVKITDFEFFFEYLTHNDKFEVFLKKFLPFYVETLHLGRFQPEISPMCLNTIVFCLDKLPVKTLRRNAKLCTVLSAFNASTTEFFKTPNLLALITILTAKMNVIVDNSVIQESIIKNYIDIAQDIDSLQQEDVESLLIAFKYLKVVRATNNSAKPMQLSTQVDIFVIAMMFLHSMLLSECDYLVHHVLEALDIDCAVAVGACMADLYEVLDKVSSQAWSLLSFATRTEQNLHERMHREVGYFFYPKGGEEVQVHKHDSAGLRRSGFNRSLPTVMVVHGYTDSRRRGVIIRLRSALVQHLDANVFVVDWHRAAGQIYFTAVSNTYHAGEQLGEFLQFLEDAGYDLGGVHLIGHSLGAQIAGVAGGKVAGRVGRITGLDPAGPLFEFLDQRNASLSLDSGDARFVDVIHSAMGSFGVVQPVGHADFYPNDGLAPQPGCTNLILAVSCSHIRAVDFYVESLNATLPQYLSRPCSTWRAYHLWDCSREDLVPMGHYTPRSARGMFYVQTNEDEPYGMNGKFYKRSLLVHPDDDVLH